MKQIVVLGSTGSIGVTALKHIDTQRRRYRVVALGAGKNSRLLFEQIERFKPLAVAVADEETARGLKARLNGSYRPSIFHGPEGMVRIASMEVADTVISAMSGSAGLLPTFEAIRKGKKIALANKETMVMAGPLVMKEASLSGAVIIPVDSEHSAILQSMRGHRRKDLRRVILTASGGPFRDYPIERLKTVTPEEALNHPTWEMGRKITIDSATLMNKGLEVIEAKWLFALRTDEIDILIHPQSIVHSLVEYMDGSVIAQMGTPDMTIPISYALAFPRHVRTQVTRLRLEEKGPLTFFKPDLARFKCLRLCLDAAQAGGSMPAVLNGSNEVAVDAFLKRQIPFVQIPEVIERTMEQHSCFQITDIQSVISADRWARQKAMEIIDTIRGCR